MLKTQPEEIGNRLVLWQDQMKTLEKESRSFEIEIGGKSGGALVSQAIDINGVSCLAASLEGADGTALRDSVIA